MFPEKILRVQRLHIDVLLGKLMTPKPLTVGTESTGSRRLSGW
jgi:hypothetical protein